MRELSIPALDGYSLGGTLFEADGADTLVVLHSATAVPQRFYRHYAEHVRARGMSALTYDYRGGARSRPRSLRGFRARMRDWGLLDMAGVLEFTSRELRPRRLLCVGHSVGGQLLGLVPNPPPIAAALTLSSQSGYWKLQGEGERLKVWAAVHVVMPGLARLFGYVPGRLFGSSEDLPAGVAREWSGWCRRPGYLLDDPSLPLERFRAATYPVRAYSIADDGWGTARSVDAMMRAYPNVEREHLDPAEHGLSKLGHFGYFRPPAAGLWDRDLDWLVAR